MNNDLVNLTLVINFVSSIVNVVVYGFGYHRTSRVQVDPVLSLTKKALLLDFLIAIIIASILSVVYAVALFDFAHLTPALYLLNIGLLISNLLYNIRAVMLALITDK